MIKENKKRLTITIPKLLVDFVIKVSQETKITKSKIISKILLNYFFVSLKLSKEQLKEWLEIKDGNIE